MGYCVGQWVGSCQITRNSIIRKLIKIFCLKIFIGSGVANYDWQFGTLPFGIFWSNLDLETYPRTYSGHF